MIEPLLQKLTEKYTGNIFFIFVVICLVLVEKFIEADFVCPCEKIYRGLFFWIYLLMPAFVAYVSVLCILNNMDELATQSRSSDMESGRSRVEPGIQPARYGSFNVDSERSCVEQGNLSARSEVEPGSSNEVQETQPLINSNRSVRKEMLKKVYILLKAAANNPYGQSFMAVFVWIVLFLSDGRYVACFNTTLRGEHAVSSKSALWEWCDTNRTLTDNQNTAEKAYYASKLFGFAFIFFLSVLALVYQLAPACCKRCCSAWMKICCDATPDELTGTVVETDDG